MLTIFGIPKPFKGAIARIQRNALASWTLLRPRPEILLFGDDEGTAEMARELGVNHVPEVARNEYGTPLVSDIFQNAQRLASHNLLCYVHADMILMSDFMRVMERARGWNQQFLVTGRRWEMDLNELLDFHQLDWEERLRRAVRETGNQSSWGIDYFAFPRGLFLDIPPLAIGRGWFDGMLIRKARNLKAPVIDATHTMMVVHQNHDYSHVASSGPAVWLTEEAKRNYELAGGGRYWLLLEATHQLTPTGLRRVWARKFRFQCQTWARALLVYRTGAIRHRLGLRRSNLVWAKNWLKQLIAGGGKKEDQTSC